MNTTIITSDPKALTTLNNYFKILHTNIRSINKNFDELQIQLKHIGLRFDIIILTECWINKKSSPMEIAGYTTYSTVTSNKQNDGVIVYLKNEIKAEVKETTITNANCLKIKIGKESTIFAIYRSPSSYNLDPFIKSLDDELTLQKETKNVFLIGDLNINILENGHPQKNEYLQILASHGLKSLINEPTRKVDNSKTCIDHIMSKTKKQTQSVIYESTITDHFTTILAINQNKDRKTQIRPTIIEKSETNWNAVKKNLQCTDWKKIQNIENANDAWNSFIDIIHHNIVSNTKKKLKKISHKNIHIKPWISQNIINCIRKRDELHKKLKQNPYDIHKLRYYKRYRNICKNIINTTKESYYKNKIDECNDNPRKMWQIINEVTNSKSTSNTSKIDELNINKVPTLYAENPDKILDHVNHFFTNIGSNLAKQITLCVNDAVEPNEARNLEREFDFKQITVDEIRNIITSLKPNVSSGDEVISTNTIKQLSEEITFPLTHLINLSITKSIFPMSLKEATVIPIYKQGSKNDINNYRPISLLSTFSKILEKVLKKQLMTYLEENNLISKSQYGFRQNLSTADAIDDILNTITKSLDKGNKSLAIFIDLQKAFDTIDHKILFKKLKKIGMSNTTLNLLISYMSERSQCVKIENRKSKPLPINYGVPQGSVLGPLLFLIYVNDICNLHIKGKIICFADDTVILFNECDWLTTFKDAEHGLVLLQKWLKQNSLTLNVNKTKYLTFSITARGQPAEDYALKLHDCQGKDLTQSCHCPTITHSKNIKYLGIEIDENLRWDSHINSITKKLTKLMYYFRNIRNILSKNDLYKVYYALCQSRIEYGIIGWGTASNIHIKKLAKTQKAIIKIILKVPIKTPSKEIFKNFNVFSIIKLYSKNALLKFKEKYEYLADQHTYTTRSKSSKLLNIPQLNTSFGQKNHNFHATKLYNALPFEIKNTMEIQMFKKDVKLWLRKQEDEEIIKIIK